VSGEWLGAIALRANRSFFRFVKTGFPNYFAVHYFANPLPAGFFPQKKTECNEGTAGETAGMGVTA
jgi:hypothetical protein